VLHTSGPTFQTKTQADLFGSRNTPPSHVIRPRVSFLFVSVQITCNAVSPSSFSYFPLFLPSSLLHYILFHSLSPINSLIMSQFIIYISFENIKQCMYLIQILNQIYQIFLTHFCLYFGMKGVYFESNLINIFLILRKKFR
jgi:hypothetical protein